MSFDVDFLGRLRKVRAPVSASIHALYEAVANAFDATAELGERGCITVRVLRVVDPSLFGDGPDGEKRYRLNGYEVEDNGVGFTDDNLAHFKKSDTRHKSAGKGVGRLLWLHVFDRAEIDSVYEHGGERRHRTFTFSEQYSGVNDAAVGARVADRSATVRTVVRLRNPMTNRVPYLAQTARALAEKLLEHFLLYFTAIRGQSLTVIDTGTGERIEVGELYHELIGDRHKEESFQIRDSEFILHHVFIKAATTRRNTISLCASRRVVTSELVNDWVRDVGRSAPVTTDGGFRYHAYVTGDFLDDVSDDERTGLKFLPDAVPSDDGEEPDLFAGAVPVPSAGEGVSKKELFEALSARIRAHLADHIQGVRKKKERQLDDFVATEQPQFRPYVDRAKQHLDRLPARPSRKDIELVLYEAKIDGRQEMTELVSRIVRECEAHKQVELHRHGLINQFAREANNANVSALAEYVCTRRAVLNVLRANLGKGSDDRHALEKVIHDLFFPRYSTSDELSLSPSGPSEREIANLWLLDERLVFHRLLASDIALNKLRGFRSTSEDEPDIVVFDPAFLTTEGDELRSIAIVEFKRPGREDYGPGKDRNPIDQLISFAKDIRAGQFEDATGRHRQIGKDVIIYGYIVCDPADRLTDLFVERNLTPTPDRQGYYYYHTTLNMLIEVVYYERLVASAERRNEAFFAKLGIPKPRL